MKIQHSRCCSFLKTEKINRDQDQFAKVFLLLICMVRIERKSSTSVSRAVHPTRRRIIWFSFVTSDQWQSSLWLLFRGCAFFPSNHPEIYPEELSNFCAGKRELIRSIPRFSSLCVFLDVVWKVDVCFRAPRVSSPLLQTRFPEGKQRYCVQIRVIINDLFAGGVSDPSFVARKETRGARNGLGKKRGRGCEKYGIAQLLFSRKIIEIEFRIPHIRKRIPKNGENLLQTLAKVHCATWWFSERSRFCTFQARDDDEGAGRGSGGRNVKTVWQASPGLWTGAIPPSFNFAQNLNWPSLRGGGKRRKLSHHSSPFGRVGRL